VRVDHGREIDLPGGPDAALLLHGLTGSTFEVHPLAERLHAAGLRVLAPVMAGHGGAPERLCGLPFTAWVEEADRELDRLRGARRTFLVGMSMGAMVACALAQRHPDRVHGMVLLSPALRLAPWPTVGAWLGRVPWLRDRILRKGRSDLSDVEMEQRNTTLAGFPLCAVAELTKLQALVDRALPGIEVPTLVVSGARDRTVTLGGARRIVERIGAGAEHVLLPGSAHLVAIDVDRERCAEASVKFLERLRAGYAAATRPLTDEEHQRRR
jgi:carboxylesterase